ncbi:hypothetical protein Pla123a_01020 [Posidoniimonas polymericola]|uniref:Uncharacterized protein n=2 Tax=Posidoniimonas polymericola TaxID=2528002 RepID=A0A5C5ZDQ6_9BACT|nr:hypothetical protein Pla123a_01020 [Posidoniimonas polymericola]
MGRRLRNLTFRCGIATAVALCACGVLAADPALAWSPSRWQGDAAPAAAEPAAPAVQLTPPARVAAHPPVLGPGEYYIDHNRAGQPGDSPYVLRDAAGQVARYVEPTTALDLRGLVGAVARVRHDTGQTLLATQLDISPKPLAGRSATVAPAQYQSADPSAPIMLEEIPIGQPAPGGLGQPELVAPSASLPPGAVGHDMRLDAPPLDAPTVDGPFYCGDACAPYGYSSSPSFLAGSLSELLQLGAFLPFGMLQQPIHGNPIDFGGWTQLGYHTDQTPLSVTRGDLGAFNDVPGGIRLQQQWFWIGRDADGSCGPDLGFRFDLMYGTDAQKTQAFGNPGAGTPGFGSWDASLDHGYYGWAMPQLYGELADGDWSLIFGHFFTPVGYEVVTAPDNFFYSHSLTMFNSEPFTHTGALATYRPTHHPNDLEVHAGYTLGWDTGFEQTNDGSTFVGGLSVRPLQSVTLAYLATAGNLGARSGGGSGYTHSIVADVAVTPRLTYVLQSDYVDYDDLTGTGLGDDQIGVNQYLLYGISRCWGVGARAEWWKTDGTSFYETTVGLNYRPLDGLVMRPELRFDRAPNRDETSLAIDAILVY